MDLFRETDELFYQVFPDARNQGVDAFLATYLPLETVDWVESMNARRIVLWTDAGSPDKCAPTKE